MYVMFSEKAKLGAYLCQLENMLLPVDNFQRSRFRPQSDVARMQPSVSVECFGGLLRILVIAFEDVPAFDADFALVVFGEIIHIWHVR